MPADIVIPVHNGESFIFDCISSALEVAEIIDSNVIVSSNACTDGTDAILSSFNNLRLKILKSEEFLAPFDNYENCLRNSDSEYVISMGADDKLNVHGQSELFSYFSVANVKPSVLFGYDEIVDINDKIRRSHEHSRHWKRLTLKKIIRNSFSGRNPNLNGAWIKRCLIDAYIKEFQPLLTDGPFARVSDLYLWNFICLKLLHENSLSQEYIYVHTPAVFYREYFESYDKYRSQEIEKNANQGRVYFIRHCIEKMKHVPKEFLPNCRSGIKVYARNNFTNLYNAHGEQSVMALFKELRANNSLYLLEQLWFLSSFSSIVQRILLFCLFTQQNWKSFVVSSIQKMRF